MRAAVIDLGTNTFHLIIAEIEGESLEIIYKTTVPVRLGQGRINENLIIREAFERGIQTLKQFKVTIDQHHVEVIRAVATSAVRSAVNGQEFVNEARNAGIDIEVISGDQEAEIIYTGVRATGIIKDTSLIMDIGGGSTEFIICSPDELIWKRSYDIGAARLMQAYFHSDPMNQDDHNAIVNHLDEVLADLKAACNTYKPGMLIGSAGAFDSFTILLNNGNEIEKLPARVLDINLFRQLTERLISSTHEQRVNMKGLIPLRVDMIVIAAIITRYVLQQTHISNLSM